jgi:5-methylthioribose kinase
MFLLSAENALEYLIDAGRLPAGSRADVAPLAWGVSNVVLRVDPESAPPLVLKQSRPQLRTKIEWLSRCERIYREADVLRVLSSRLPAGSVPAARFEDRQNFILALEAIRPDHVVWKQTLLEGTLDLTVADRLGMLLGTIHSSTVGRQEVLHDAEDWSLFDELRIDPFYRYLARTQPDLAPLIDRLLADMAAHRQCLVHADFSPKNVLVHPDGITLVDFETGHWGDPAFDLGFFLAHILLKSLRFPAHSDSWQALVEAFYSRYTITAGHVRETDRRAVVHLAACLRARIDGKSPVDYLHESWQEVWLRETTSEWLATPPETLTAAWKVYFQRLSVIGNA